MNTSFWLQMSAIPEQYAWLSKDQQCDIVVLGDNIFAAATTLKLAQSGASVIQLSSGKIGMREALYNAGLDCNFFDGGFCDNKLFKNLAECKTLYDLVEDSINQFDSLNEDFGL